MVISYHINKTYVAKVLCENKEVPQMQCNGKCQLKKQMVAEETKKESEPVSVEKMPEVFWTTTTEATTEKQFPITISKPPISLFFQSHSFPSSVFRPPTVG